MKELTVFEMEEISGGYTWDFSSITSTITSLASNAVEALAIGTLGAIIVSAVGTWIGGVQGGHNGGILGLGLLGNAAGAVVGFVLGAITGAAGAVAFGWDKSMAIFQEFIDSALDGTFAPGS